MARLSLGAVFGCTSLCALVLVTAAVALAQSGSVAQAQTRPEFTMGFKAVAAQIPGIVGQPVEDEQATASGDTQQRTTRGLMAWRKADNRAAFTNGNKTWIQGPYGLAERFNSERFAWETSQPTPATPVTTFDDPFAYCAAVGTLDRVDSRYTGPAVPESIRIGLARATGASPSAQLPERGIFWRCYNGKVLACTVGANLNCGLADTSTEPNQGMVKFCQDNPNSDFIPLAVVGHEGIYAWQCRQGQPVIERQTFTVDPRGFVAEFWYQISPSGGSG